MKNENYWKKHYLNPEEVSENEKTLWLKIEPLVINLLDELKANGKIRTTYKRLENSHLVNIFLNRNEIVKNFNVFMLNIGSAEKKKPSLKKLYPLDLKRIALRISLSNFQLSRLLAILSASRH